MWDRLTDYHECYPRLWDRPPDPPWKITGRRWLFGALGLRARHAVWGAIEEAQSRGNANQEPEIVEYLRLPRRPVGSQEFDVLMVSNVLLPPRGGGTRSFLHFGEQLAAAGLRVAAVSMGPAMREFVHNGIAFRWIVHEDDLDDALESIRCRRLFCQQHWARRAAAHARQRGIPFWFFVRSPDDLGDYGEHSFSVDALASDLRPGLSVEASKTAAVGGVVRDAERVIANSRFMGDVVTAVFGRSCDVVFPGIAPARPWETRRSAVSQNIVALGGSTKKGMKTVLDLAAALPDQTVVLCGVKKLPTWVKERELPENLFWLGQLHPTVAYALARLVIMPSQWPEPAGRVNAEAVVRGIPILASRVGGIPEILDDPRFLVEDFSSSSAWVRAVSELLATMRHADWPGRRAAELGVRYEEMAQPPRDLMRLLQPA